MLEQIPSNPEDSVIRGDWASDHCDCTSTSQGLSELREGDTDTDGPKGRFLDKWDIFKGRKQINETERTVHFFKWSFVESL